LGIYFGASLVRRRSEPEMQNGKILRHDEVAFFEHWMHALATLLLLVTGVHLGFLLVPRLVQRPESVGLMLNLHFVGVVMFLFGIAYYLTDDLLTGGIKEHWPEPGDFRAAVADYMAKFGGGRAPEEGKYLASEKLSYPLWVLVVGGVIVTGAVKVAAHVWSLPGALMGPVTFLHDLAAFGVMASLVIHIVAAAVLPWSWPLLGAMLTGYVSEDYARKNHSKWFREVKKRSTGTEATPGGKDPGTKGAGLPATS
jgi:formate dehydrogenase subunit gamma